MTLLHKVANIYKEKIWILFWFCIKLFIFCSSEDSASTESLHQARMEMHSALKQRRDALQEKIKEKEEELRLLCVREGELTGELPPEYPVTPGQPPPTVRKRVGTSFALSENLISKIIKQVRTLPCHLCIVLISYHQHPPMMPHFTGSFSTQFPWMHF